MNKIVSIIVVCAFLASTSVAAEEPMKLSKSTQKHHLQSSSATTKSWEPTAFDINIDRLPP